MLSLREQGVRVVAILRQYDIASSTFYYWLSRYEAYETYSNLSRAPKQTEPKVTPEIKAEVIETHKANPKLGCWRLSLFEHVTYQKPRGTIAQLENLSDVDVNIPPGVKHTNAVALVIGIEKYQNVPTADYADRDAIAFQQYLVTLLGVDESNVIPLMNERATLAGINTGLRRLENRVTPGQSDVFVFYSGHGVPTIDGTQKFLIPHDGDPNFPQDSGYPLMRLYERLSTLNVRSVTVFVDACFSGTDKNNTLIITSAKPVLTVIEGPGAYPNLEIFSSSSGAQISSSYDDKRHGLFTYYLLEGMRGDADRNTDGKITLEELEAYVKANVSTQARRIMGREQAPMLTGQKERVLVQFK